MSLNMLSITLLLLVCIGVHTCVCMLCSFVQVLVSVWVYMEVRGNLLGCCSLGTIHLVFDFFRHSCSLVWSLPSGLSWLVSEHQLSTCLHLPSAWSISTMLPHLGSVLVGCFGFWQGFWRLKSGPLFTVSWASTSLTMLYLKHFILSMAIYSWVHPILSYGRNQEGSGPVNT